MAAPPATLVPLTAAENTAIRQNTQYDYALDILLSAANPVHPLRVAFNRLGFTEFADILGMSEADIDGLTYPEVGHALHPNIPVPKGHTNKSRS